MKINWFKTGLTAICTVATVLLTLGMILVPPLAFLLGLSASIFVSYLYIKNGVASSVINAVITCGVIIILGGGRSEILLFSAIGIVPGLVSGIMQKRRFDYYEALIGVSLAFGTVIIAALYAAGREISGGIGGLFDQTANSMKELLPQLMAESGVTGIEQKDLSNFIEELMYLVKRTIPYVLIILSMLFGYIHMVITELIMRKTSDIRLNYVRFDEHKAPKSLSYLYFVAIIILMFSEAESAFGVILENSVAVLDFILAFCGLSFIESKFKEKLRYGILRGLIYAAVLLAASSVAMQILSIIGMLDSFANYRGIRRIGD